MIDFLSELFDTSDFPPRWRCGVWDDAHGWLHIVSDLAIFGAYTAIPLVIAFFVVRKKQDIPFPRIMWLFVIFIFACGTTHLIEAIIFWQPIYRFAGTVKLITAIASWSTVAALFWIIPEALKLPGLATLNNELAGEIEERRRVERERESLLLSERAARSAAEQANRMTDEFLSVVSHELRTPLSAILGYAQLLRMGMVESDEMAEAYAAIERNSQAQVRIIDDLLDMSRIISGKLRIHPTSVYPCQAVEAALETIRPAAEAKGVQLIPSIDTKAGPVFGDFDRLQQVVWNLVSNAVKFTPKGGHIEVSLARIDSHVEIAVSDTGCGISAKFLPHVFERYRQWEESTTRRHGGLGLGLAIVRQLVELHGGTVKAASEGENQGAIFTVSLPMQEMQHESGEHAPRATASNGDAEVKLPNLDGVSVLVIDDEVDTSEVVRHILEHRGAEVTAVNSGREALKQLNISKPDVIVSDIGMPEMDGYQLIREIRSVCASDGKIIPAVALTAFARSEDRKRALMAGFQSHVTKPVDQGELVAVIAMLTKRTIG